jgi:hypothetical protein
MSAVAADFFFSCWYLEIPSDRIIIFDTYQGASTITRKAFERSFSMQAGSHLFVVRLVLLDPLSLGRSRSYFTTDGQSVSQYILVSGTLSGHFTFSFLLPENCFALHLGAPPLTRERISRS